MNFTLVNKLNMQRYVRSTADLTELQWWSDKGGTDFLCLLSGWLSHWKCNLSPCSLHIATSV